MIYDSLFDPIPKQEWKWIKRISLQGFKTPIITFLECAPSSFLKYAQQQRSPAKVAVLKLSSARSENNTKCSLFITDKLWIMVCYGTL